MEESRERTAAIDGEITQAPGNMERSDEMDEAIIGPTDAPTSRTGELAGVGKAARTACVSLRASSKCCDYRRLRVAELTRLLNSTPLGQVISDRQLYRHRERADHVFTTDNRLDLLRYVAWLAVERHSPRQRARRRSKTCSYERVRWRVTISDVLALLERQEYRCALTGRQLEPSTAALDHIVPVSRGGEHDFENAQVLHREVNRAKGALANEQFVRLCREVAAHTDSNPSPVPGMKQST